MRKKSLHLPLFVPTGKTEKNQQKLLLAWLPYIKAIGEYNCETEKPTNERKKRRTTEKITEFVEYFAQAK